MKRGLLVIDVQNEYFTGKLPVSHPPGSFDNILRAMDAARSHRVSVIVVQHTARSDASPIFRKGTHEWSLHPAVDLRPRDVLIEKNWPDSFAETGLEEWVEGAGIDTLAICGYMTQMCCDTTARGAFHKGYAVEFLSDATGTLAFSNETGTVTDEELHRTVLTTQGSRFSRVMKTGEWIDRVSRGA